jgi:hypothetical protein
MFKVGQHYQALQPRDILRELASRVYLLAGSDEL